MPVAYCLCRVQQQQQQRWSLGVVSVSPTVARRIDG